MELLELTRAYKDGQQDAKTRALLLSLAREAGQFPITDALRSAALPEDQQAADIVGQQIDVALALLTSKPRSPEAYTQLRQAMESLRTKRVLTLLGLSGQLELGDDYGLASATGDAAVADPSQTRLPPLVVDVGSPAPEVLYLPVEDMIRQITMALLSNDVALLRSTRVLADNTKRHIARYRTIPPVQLSETDAAALRTLLGDKDFTSAKVLLDALIVVLDKTLKPRAEEETSADISAASALAAKSYDERIVRAVKDMATTPADRHKARRLFLMLEERRNALGPGVPLELADCGNYDIKQYPPVVRELPIVRMESVHLDPQKPLPSMWYGSKPGDDDDEMDCQPDACLITAARVFAWASSFDISLLLPSYPTERMIAALTNGTGRNIDDPMLCQGSALYAQYVTTRASFVETPSSGEFGMLDVTGFLTVPPGAASYDNTRKPSYGTYPRPVLSPLALNMQPAVLYRLVESIARLLPEDMYGKFFRMYPRLAVYMLPMMYRVGFPQGSLLDDTDLRFYEMRLVSEAGVDSRHLERVAWPAVLSSVELADYMPNYEDAYVVDGISEQARQNLAQASAYAAKYLPKALVSTDQENEEDYAPLDVDYIPPGLAQPRVIYRYRKVSSAKRVAAAAAPSDDTADL